jgi:Domain of unknown function (DUF4397)
MHKSLRSIFSWLASGLLMSAISACGGGDAQTRIRFVNGIVDSAPIDTTLDSRLIGSFSFRQASADYALNEGIIALKLSQANNATAFFTNSTNYEKGKRTTQIALGKLSAGVPTGTSLLTVIDANNAASSNNFKLRFAHAAPDLGALDVYLTPDGKDFSTDTPRYNLPSKSVAPNNATNALELANGKYRLRLTLGGTKNIVYDSGNFSEVSGADSLYVILPSDNLTGASAATILSIPSVGNFKEMADSRTGFRFANFGTNTAFGGNYDVYLRDASEALSASNKLFSGTQAGTASTRADIQAGNKRLTLTQPGSTLEVLGFDISLIAGKRQTAYLVGNAASPASPQALKLTLTLDESAAPLVGQSKVRLLNLDSASAAARDLVTITSNGSGTPTLGSRLAIGIGYLSATNPYQTVPSGSYQLATVTTTLTSPLAPDAAGVAASFSAQRSYSVIETAAPTRLVIVADD